MITGLIGGSCRQIPSNSRGKWIAEGETVIRRLRCYDFCTVLLSRFSGGYIVGTKK